MPDNDDTVLPPSIQAIPPSPMPETPKSGCATKYFTFENKLFCDIWLKFPGRATGKFHLIVITKP